MDEAARLGAHYGLNGAELERLRTAALLHDCAKKFCDEASFEELYLYCAGTEYWEYLQNDLFKRLPTLAHSYVGAVMARKEYGIEDTEILSAIAHHTFGRAGMSLIEKIVYLADYLEPGRLKELSESGAENFLKARDLAYEDIDRAMLFMLGSIIEKNERAGKTVYYKSLEALEYLSREEK